MSITLSPSNLEVTSAYGESGWAALYNQNFTDLNNTLLKLANLLDVTMTGVQNGEVIVWDVASSKWIRRKPRACFLLVTLTSTTSSSSSSSTLSTNTSFTYSTISTVSTISTSSTNSSTSSSTASTVTVFYTVYLGEDDL
jgi:hypothetical protein